MKNILFLVTKINLLSDTGLLHEKALATGETFLLRISITYLSAFSKNSVISLFVFTGKDRALFFF